MAVDWHGADIMARVRAGALKGVGEGIGIVEKRAIELILHTAKTGRLYRRRGVVHQASAPGEPFASDTGATIEARTIEIDAAELRGRLAFRSENASRLEHGTKKMDPRPFARRALSETRSQVSDAVAAAIVAELRGDGK
jgi:hypothetical protein